MDTNKNPFCGMSEFPKEVYNGLKETVTGLNEILKDDLSEARNHTLPAGEVPWDVSWRDLLGGFLALILALGFLFPAWMIIVIIKFLPFMFRLYLEFWHNFLDSHHSCPGWCCLGVLFFFGNIFLPLIPVLAVVICALHGLACCFYSVYVCYDYNLLASIKYMCAIIRRYDAHTHYVIMGGWWRNHDAPSKSIFDLCRCCDVDGEISPYTETVVSFV